MTFTEWSGRWKGERKNVQVEIILDLWQAPLPRQWERAVWEGRLGYRKRSDQRGEQKIERLLFDNRSGGLRLSFKGRETQQDQECRIEAIYHNMPLANQQPGQVLADAFGVLTMPDIQRPLLIEVKVDAQNPWFALVENLQQVRLARACAQKIKDWVHERTGRQVERGIWGLVLAPSNYFRKHAKSLADAKELLNELKRRTQARIAFGISDFLVDGRIEIIESNWQS